MLVTQLDSQAFAERQAAEHGLRGWGVAALPALEAALDVPDLEQRRRVQRLVRNLCTLQAERNLSRWRLGQMPARLGLWNHFRRTVGDSPASREIFWSLYALEGAAFEELDRAIRCRDWAEVRQLANNAVARTLPSEPTGRQSPDYPPSTSNRLMTVLFLSQLPGAERRAETEELLISNMIASNELQTISFKRNQNARVLQALVIHWFAAHRAYSSNQDLMLQLIALEIREPGLEFARKRLQGKATPSEKAIAASYLGWYGRPADAALILPLLDDKTPYRDRFANVQVRDIALAAIHKLTRADLGTTLRPDRRPTVMVEITFYLLSGPVTQVRPSMQAPLFANDTEREATFAAWRKWVAVNPGKLPAMRK
jgi:hypothetical protein